MLQDVPDDHLDLILDAAAEKYKRMRNSAQDDTLSPMSSPEDINQDFQSSPSQQAPANQGPVKDTINLARPKTQQENDDQRAYQDEQTLNQLKDNGQNPTYGNDQVQPIESDPSRDPAGAILDPTSTTPQLPTNTQLSQGAPSKGNPISLDQPKLLGNDPLKLTPIPKVGSTTPKDAAQTKKNLGSLTDYVGNNLKGADALYDTNVAADTAKHQADQDAAQSGMGYYADKLNNQQNFIMDINNRVNDAKNQLNSEMSKMVNVDPNRIWNTSSMGGKIGFLVSAAYGGLDANGPLQKLITNDINAQVQDIKTHGAKADNLVSMMQKYTGNLMDASKMAADFQNKYFELSVQAKKAGAALNPAIITQQALAETAPYQDKKTAQAIAVQKLALEQEKQSSQQLQDNASNTLKRAGLIQGNEELNYKNGTPDSQDLGKIPSTAGLFRAAKTMNDLEKNGVDPSSPSYRAFVYSQTNPGLLKEGMASLVSKLSPELTQSYNDHLNATREFLKQERLSKPGGRSLTEQQLDTFANGQLPKMFSTPETVRRLQLDRLKTVNETLGGFSPGGQRFLKDNYIGNSSPVVYRQNQGR